MEFRYLESDEIPKLSWCGCLEKGNDEVFVVHGNGVETTDRCFHEGVWSGQFADHAIDQAIMMSGSGARVFKDDVLFVTPSHLGEKIYTAQRGSLFYAANSLTCLFAALGEKPSIDEPDYHFRVLESYRRGNSVECIDLKTDSGNSIQIRNTANFYVGRDLQIRVTPKPVSPFPKNFDIYIESLREVSARLIANATDVQRKQSFIPLTTVSVGYDSTAVAALAVSLGYSDALCIQSTLEDGRSVAERLGMNVMTIDREAFMRKKCNSSEFYVLGLGHASVFSEVESELSGRLLLTGYYGDSIWSLNREIFEGAEISSMPTPEGISHAEFRLRVGYCTMALASFGAEHGVQIQAVSRSREMRAWQTRPRSYSRPIPRRMVEAQGVPRGFFGQVKKATGHVFISDSMSPSLKREFRNFLAQIPETLLEDRRSLAARAGGFGIKLAYFVLSKVPRRFVQFHRSIQRWRYVARTHWLWASKELYAYHWAIEKNIPRYHAVRKKLDDLLCKPCKQTPSHKEARD